VEFAGQLFGSAQRLKFTNASLVLDGNTGIGGFDISFDGAVPAMSGTLAFDVLDLPTAFSVFSPLLPQASPALSGPTPLIDRMKLDLRLSASTARAGPVTLSEIAATAQVRPGLAVLDISDSTAFGGTFQAGIRADRTAGSESVDLRLLAANVNGGKIGDALGLQALVPAARGTLSLSLSGRGTSWQQVLETANGSLSAQFEAGTLRAFNLDTFLARLNDGGFFAWKDVTDGSLAVDALQVKATMEAGVARVAEVSVDAPQRSVLLHGIVPYVGGLALSGSVVQRAAGEPLPQPSTAEDRIQPSTVPLASFFVGGSWKAPFISPTTVRPPPVPSGG
jgi:AsmA protein